MTAAVDHMLFYELLIVNINNKECTLCKRHGSNETEKGGLGIRIVS